MSFNRDLNKGSAELLVLTLLEGRPRHGYDIGKLIEEQSGRPDTASASDRSTPSCSVWRIAV